MKQQEGEKVISQSFQELIAGVELVIPGVTGLCPDSLGSGSRRPANTPHGGNEGEPPTCLPRTTHIHARRRPRSGPPPWARVMTPTSQARTPSHFLQQPSPLPQALRKVRLAEGSQSEAQDGEGLAWRMALSRAQKEGQDPAGPKEPPGGQKLEYGPLCWRAVVSAPPVRPAPHPPPRLGNAEGRSWAPTGRESAGAGLRRGHAGCRPAFQPDRVCQPGLLGPHESWAGSHRPPRPAGRHFLLHLDSRGSPLTPRTLGGSGLSLPCSPHPQDILKYTFSFLQLERGGSRPQNRAGRGRPQPQAAGDARFPETHLETTRHPCTRGLAG